MYNLKNLKNLAGLAQQVETVYVINIVRVKAADLDLVLQLKSVYVSYNDYYD